MSRRLRKIGLDALGTVAGGGYGRGKCSKIAAEAAKAAYGEDLLNGRKGYFAKFNEGRACGCWATQETFQNAVAAKAWAQSYPNPSKPP